MTEEATRRRPRHGRGHRTASPLYRERDRAGSAGAAQPEAWRRVRGVRRIWRYLRGRPSPEGFYFNDTRFLSYCQLLIEGKRPLLLSSVVQDDNVALSVDLANPDVHVDGAIVLPRDAIGIERTKFLWLGVLYERIGFRNFLLRRLGGDLGSISVSAPIS